MKKIVLSDASLYIDELYFEDSQVLAGSITIMLAKPHNYRVISEAWICSKGTVGHIWADRERAFALIRLAFRFMNEGLLNQKEAEKIVLAMDMGWHCPAHPLVPITGPNDSCYECLIEVEKSK
jgi:hypothetical protein